MRIEFPKKTQSRLCRKSYVPLKSSFLTLDGPTAGTVWFDLEAPENEPLIVDEVSKLWVFFTDDSQDSVATFVDRVAKGRYVLVGFVPTPAAITST